MALNIMLNIVRKILHSFHYALIIPGKTEEVYSYGYHTCNIRVSDSVMEYLDIRFIISGYISR